MKSTVTVVATYNEAGNIRSLIESIALIGSDVDVLVVDDNSPDGTGQIAEELATNSAAIHVLHRDRLQGLGPALYEGFSWALDRGYEKILNLDGDHSHNPKDIPLLLAKAEEWDLVIGSRYLNGIRVVNWPPRRLALSLAAASFVRTVTGMPICDPTSGFRCFRRKALSLALREPPLSRGYSIHIEMLHRIWCADMQVCEVPILFKDRAGGSTKMNGSIILEAIWITLCLLMGNGMRRSPRGGHVLDAKLVGSD